MLLLLEPDFLVVTDTKQIFFKNFTCTEIIVKPSAFPSTVTGGAAAGEISVFLSIMIRQVNQISLELGLFFLLKCYT